MQLQASDNQGHQVSKSMAVEWPCEQDYFFEPGLERCSAAGPIQTWTAEQPFMRGRMLWLEAVGLEEEELGLFLVLYQDGSYEAYRDTWS